MALKSGPVLILGHVCINELFICSSPQKSMLLGVFYLLHEYLHSGNYSIEVPSKVILHS